MTTILLLVIAGQYTPVGYFKDDAQCTKRRLELVSPSPRIKLECRTVTTEQANVVAELTDATGKYHTRYSYKNRRFRP